MLIFEVIGIVLWGVYGMIVNVIFCCGNVL